MDWIFVFEKSFLNEHEENLFKGFDINNSKKVKNIYTFGISTVNKE